MAASKRYQLAKAAQRKQATLSDRATSRDMPSVISASKWESARNAYFGAAPHTYKEILGSQMAAVGAE